MCDTLVDNSSNSNSSNSNSNAIRIVVVDKSKWTPCQEEWDKCVGVLNDEKEKQRIMGFKRPDSLGVWRSGKDNDSAKSSMLGRLLMIYLTRSMLDIPQSTSISFQRTSSNKPFYVNNVNSNNREPSSASSFSFNVSHDSDVVVIAGSVGIQYPSSFTIGIDVMKHELPKRQPLNQYFSDMKSCFTSEEWKTISDPSLSDMDQIKMFFVHWCLKESYIKSDGKGLEIELTSFEFKLSNDKTSATMYTRQRVDIDDYEYIQDTQFKFQLLYPTLLDSNDQYIMAICVPVSPTTTIPALTKESIEFIDINKLID
ncbi:hypothetical protein CYY_004887 [Polysphondylium violaceum]|uniref:holo-[acyl-carrier-protein] synthase n=1 Tax=Polysphondylium violaceum TaxID=133409 RepID=A0A8J4PTW3_9MYCE|nr:hypothetical protein CYY_004887 [Polysphondylium violaceum]